jgi:hypothetical protein
MAELVSGPFGGSLPTPRTAVLDDPRNAMIAVWAIVLCVILPVGLVANTGQASSDAYVLQWVVLIHTGLALAYILGSGQPRPLHLGFWSFSYGWLGLAPIVQLSHDTYPLTVIFSQTIAFRASAITEVGLLAYTVTWVLSSRESLRPSRYRYLDGRAIVWRRVVVIAVIATVATIYTVPHLGGLHAVFTSRQATNEVPSAGVSKAKQSVSAWGASVPAFWALLALLFVSRTNGRRAIRTIGGAFLLAVLVVVNVVINNPISQPRFWAGTVLLGIVFATTRARVNWRLVSATFVILLIVAFPYVDYFRYTHAGPITVTSMSSQLAANDDYDAYQQEETAVFYQGKTGYHPNYALGSLFFFVPRSIWASKPVQRGLADQSIRTAVDRDVSVGGVPGSGHRVRRDRLVPHPHGPDICPWLHQRGPAGTDPHPRRGLLPDHRPARQPAPVHGPADPARRPAVPAEPASAGTCAPDDPSNSGPAGSVIPERLTRSHEHSLSG